MKIRVTSSVLLLILIFPVMARSQVKIQQTAGHDALGDFAPEFARLNDDILFGEVWSRNDLLSLGSFCRNCCCAYGTRTDRFFV